MLSTPPWDGRPDEDSDDSSACSLKSFAKRVLHKVDSWLIHQHPKQPSLAKPMLSLQSKRLVLSSKMRS
jgi:hypothetical protein